MTPFLMLQARLLNVFFGTVLRGKNEIRNMQVSTNDDVHKTADDLQTIHTAKTAETYNTTISKLYLLF